MQETIYAISAKAYEAGATPAGAEGVEQPTPEPATAGVGAGRSGGSADDDVIDADVRPST